MTTLFKKQKLALVLFTAPLLIVFTAIIIVPLIQSAAMSFTNWDGVNTPTMAGLDNYKRLFASPDLLISMRNSVLYSVVLTVYQLGLGTFFAFVLVNVQIKCKRFFKDTFFLPMVLSVTVVSQLWIAIYHGDFGLINQAAKALGSDWRQYWLSEPVKGLIAVVLTESWRGLGYHMLIIYAAMQNVPKMYYEASTIDGASTAQQFRHITLPLIAQTLKVCFIMCITFGFRAFEQIFIMTSGGPGNYTYTLSIMLYKAIFGLQKYGYASAIAVVIVILCVGIMQLIERLLRRTEIEY